MQRICPRSLAIVLLVMWVMLNMLAETVSNLNPNKLTSRPVTEGAHRSPLKNCVGHISKILVPSESASPSLMSQAVCGPA